ncbi:MAG: glycoside hydrolase N-terminal domain-containing protein [Bacteroidales bacterium]|nr:glycoside hydrolase N-terminal domain-containing protein [Bacteroidales bacterium]
MKRILSLFLLCIIAVASWAQLPEFSSTDSPKFFFVKFASGNFLNAPSNGAKLVTTNSAAKPGTQWAFVGSKSNFKMVTENGLWCKYSGDRFVATDSQNDASALGIYSRSDGNFEIYITSDTSRGMNQWGATSAGVELGLWQRNNGNNSLNFVTIEDVDLTDYSALDAALSTEYAQVSASATYTSLPEDINDLRVWFNKPGTKTGVGNVWMEYSQPIGNGHLGASLFGGIYCDQLQFNEKSLWSGKSELATTPTYGFYRNFGSLLVVEEGEGLDLTKTNPITKYVRYLDIEDAVGGVNFNRGGGLFTRRYIASEPDDVIAAHYTAPEGQKLAFCISYYPGESINNSRPVYNEAYGEFHGSLDLVSYNTQFRVVPLGEGASIYADEKGIHVANADEVLVLLAGKTDYDGTNMKTFTTGASAEDLATDIRTILDRAADKGWAALLADHKTNYRSYFDRVKLNLSTGTADAASNKNTQSLVDYFSQSTNYKTKDGLYLQQLYFQYGRYLMISCSRGPLQVPSNLQGLWNNKANAPWHSDVHTNINIQMNYWPAEPTNLSECHMPLLDHIINLSNSPGWTQAAKNNGQTGWTVYTESNIFGGMSDFMPNYVVANAWYCTHLWQHYRYTLDRDYLKRAFPTMWAAAKFWTERLKKNSADGTWECPNEWSPENHSVSKENAVAHAQQLVIELLQNVSDAIDVLGDEANVTDTQVKNLRTKLEGMDTGLHTETYDGAWGNPFNGISKGTELLREWKVSPYSKAEKNHRHLSHLMCLYPFNQVYPGHEYFEPAVNSLRHRGDAATGWSLGWKVNCWARAQDGDHAMIIIRNALKHSTSYETDQNKGGVYYNLYDSHAPFQIDGNFGTCAGIAELLMQSGTGIIDLLPALPSVWPKGEVSGLKAVGNFTIDIAWEKKLPTLVTIRSHKGQPLRVKAGEIDLTTVLVAVNGAEVTPVKNEDGTFTIEGVQADDVVTIDFTSTPGAEGIESVKANTKTPYTFDLQGRRNTNTGNGIFVTGGKKVIR